LPDFIEPEFWTNITILNFKKGSNYKTQLSILLDSRRFEYCTIPNSNNLSFPRKSYSVENVDAFLLEFNKPISVVPLVESCKIMDSDYVIGCYKCSEKGRKRCKDCKGEKVLECNECNGHGFFRCGKCKGKGEVQDFNYRDVKVRCSKCFGRGGYNSNICSYCHGSGEMWDYEKVFFNVTCRDCSGRGVIICSKCGGKKYYYVILVLQEVG
jgi:DnaJ-class molecular chaperone